MSQNGQTHFTNLTAFAARVKLYNTEKRNILIHFLVSTKNSANQKVGIQPIIELDWMELLYFMLTKKYTMSRSDHKVYA